MLMLNSQAMAKARTKYPMGVTKPMAIIKLTQANQDGNTPERKETDAVAPMMTAKRMNMSACPNGAVPNSPATVPKCQSIAIRKPIVTEFEVLRYAVMSSSTCQKYLT